MAVLTEIVAGLLLMSGLTDTLVRDVGLLALALVWAIDMLPRSRGTFGWRELPGGGPLAGPQDAPATPAAGAMIRARRRGRAAAP